MKAGEMAVEENNQDKTIRERMAEEEKVRERVDAQGVKWKKVYFGGGEHFKNWLAQCRELGEVEVEEVNSRGYKCFEEAGEKLYRIWLRVEEAQGDGLF
jgi:argininosuccinate lyase